MNIIQFVKKLVLSKLGKKDIRDKLRGVVQKLEEVVLASIASILETASIASAKSSYGIKFTNDFMRMLPSSLRSKTTPYAVIQKSLENASKLATLLDDFVGKDMPEQIYIDGITYQRATILRLVELLDFTADYASRQACYYVAAESNVQALGEGDKLPFTKAEEVAIISQQAAYFKAIELLYADPKSIMANLDKIPEVIITTDAGSDIASNLAGGAAVMSLGVIPIISPLFLFIGERKADWDYERYERCKKERKDIELRIEMMRQRGAGQVDARSESILKGYERELTLVRDRIAQLEVKAAR